MLTHKKLYKFDATTNLILEVDVKKLSKKIDPRQLALDPMDGRLWLAGKHGVLVLDREGKLVLEWSITDHVRDFALGLDGSLWFITPKKLVHLSAVGSVLHEVDLKQQIKNPRWIAVDSLSAKVWLASRRRLVQLDANNPGGSPKFVFPASSNGEWNDDEAEDKGDDDDRDSDEPDPVSIRGIALDPLSGRAWVATKRELRSYNAAGEAVDSAVLPKEFKNPEVLASDHASQSLWLTAKKKLGRFSTSGELLSELSADDRIQAFAVAPLGITPQLTLLAPADGVLIGNARPAVRLQLSALCNASACAPPASYLHALTLDAALNGSVVSDSFVISNSEAVFTPSQRLPEGMNSLTARVIDAFGHTSNRISSTFTIDTIPPSLLSLTPPDGFVTREAAQKIAGQSSEPALVTINGSPVVTDANNAFSSSITLVEGENTYTVVAQDPAGNATQRILHITLDTVVPAPANAGLITLGAINNGQATITGAAGSVEAGATVGVTNLRTLGLTSVAASASGAFTAAIVVQPGDTLSISATDAAGNSSAAIRLTVPGTGSGETLPPDPTVNPSSIDRTVTTTIGGATAFLYSGVNPIQTGVAPETIDAKRAAVLRGRVQTRNGDPLPGVTLTILKHPEFGQTVSRSNGMFDLAVNGGSYLTINYEKAGYLPVQRRVRVPWQDYVVAPDVVMIPLESQSTVIDLSSTAPMQVARGSVVNDKDGTRQATLLFPQGVNATAVLADGTTRPLATLTVRATEYTVGSSGPNAMPGELPPTSGYTYAVEYSVDEALGLGARAVQFSQPVYQYVDNFLNFPVGTIVPLAYYDRERAVWVPSPNGRVVKILGVVNGAAEIDIRGGGTPADEAALAAMNFTLDERVQLASLYPVGKSLWRAPIPHFSAWDSNWGIGPPPGAEPPKVPDPEGTPPDKPDCKEGSVIECQSQSLGESVPVTGTVFTLNYKSSRMAGFRASNTSIRIPLSGATLPPGVKRIDTEVHVAGRVFTQTFAATPDQNFVFQWDGIDAYGRAVQGAQPALVRVGYVYDAAYRSPADLQQSFGYNGGGIISSNPGRTEMTLWQDRHITIGSLSASAAGLGGWTLSSQHAYDPIGRVLYLGDGRHRSADELPNVMDVFAGGGTDQNGDGGPATNAKFVSPKGIAVGSDGSVYFSAFKQVGFGGHPAIRRVDPNGIISTFATVEAWSLDVTDDGSVYAAETNVGRAISRLTADGARVVVVENDMNPTALKIGPDGSLYHAGIVFSGSPQIRKLDPAGNIGTLAFGNRVGVPQGIGLDAAGSVYWTDVQSIIRTSPDGRSHRVAGDGFFGGSGTEFDGAIATNVQLGSPFSLTVDIDGTFYIGQDGVVRRVKNGIIRTFATGIGRATGLALGHQGELYIVSNDIGRGQSPDRVMRVRPAFPKFSANNFTIVSDDGTQSYQFDPSGRHLRTVDTYTGAILFEFTYSNGLVSEIRDDDGNVTRIERDTNGSPTAIVSPDGLRTVLTVDTSGYLATITNPAGEATRMTYTADGLMTTFTNARNQTSTMTYDPSGRLIRDENAAGGFWQLSRMDFADGSQVSMVSALGRTTTYRTEFLNSGVERRTNTYPDGTTRVTEINNALGVTTVTSADGTVSTTTLTADPRFGMQAPLASGSVRLPSGLTLAASTTRSVVLGDPGIPLSLVTETTRNTVNGKTFTSVYDASGRQTTTTSPEGRQVVSTVDSQSRVTQQQIAGLEPINYTYDTRGRLSGISQGTGASQRSTAFSYNTQGFLDSMTDAANRTTSFSYDAVGRLTRQALPDGRVIQYTYDANGNVTSITPPSRPVHAFGYTPVDLEDTYTPPAAGLVNPATRYTYNLDKQLTSVLRPDGQMISFDYDTAGRLSTVTLPDRTITSGYNTTTGHLASLDTSEGVNLAYTYDGFLPVGESSSGPVAGSVTRNYDNDFRIVGIGVNGNNISFAYDNDSFLTQAGDLTLTRSVQNGLLTATTFGNISTSHSHNGFGEATQFIASQGGTNLLEIAYTRDNLGRITQKSETVIGDVPAMFAYTYDVAGRLTEVTKDGITQAVYVYDANGNRLSKNATNGSYDEQDRLLTYGANVYSYTANGELSTKTNTATGSTTSYTYDALGNLTNVTLPDATNIEYVIDARNRRIGKRVDGALVQGFLYQDQLKPIAELDGQGNVISRFVYADKTNVPSYMIRGATTYRIISDHLGSPRLVVNTSNGNVEQRVDYDEFGNITWDSNPGFQPFGFAGGLYDRDTKLTRFGARDYDSETGRWTAKDPIGFAGGDTNLFGYVRNEPINWIDPWGLDPFSMLGIPSVAVPYIESEIRSAPEGLRQGLIEGADILGTAAGLYPGIGLGAGAAKACIQALPKGKDAARTLCAVLGVCSTMRGDLADDLVRDLLRQQAVSRSSEIARQTTSTLVK